MALVPEIIIKTVGNGGDFSNWNDAFAYVPLTFETNLKLVQISDITITSLLPVFGNTYNANGFTFTICSAKPHYGIINRGYKTIVDIPAGNDEVMEIAYLSENFNMYNMNFEIKSFNDIARSVLSLTPGRGASSPAVNLFKNVYNNIFNLNGLLSNAIRIEGNLIVGGVTPVDSIWNNKILQPTTYPNSGGINVKQFEGTGDGGVYIENNSVYGTQPGNGINTLQVGGTITNMILKNNAVFISPHGGSFDFQYHANSKAYNNMSGDDTADDAPVQSNNYINAVFEDEFEADISKDNFFRPLRHSQAYNGGVAVSIGGNLAGIGGHPRPHTI